jgi:hypothetical protein
MSLFAFRRWQRTSEEKLNRARRIFGLIVLAAGPVWLQQAPAGAASATATFQVTVRVVKSCKVAPQSLATQSSTGNETITVECGTGAEPANSQSGGTIVGTTSPSTNVNYGVSELPGADGALTIITINF